MERDRDETLMSALRQELLQSGLTLAMNPSAIENYRKEESSRPIDSIFSSGDRGRLAADPRFVSVGIDKADGIMGDKLSRREVSSMVGLGDRRPSKSTLQYDPRSDTLHAMSQVGFLSDSIGLNFQSSSTQNHPLFIQSMVSQRNPASLSLLNDESSEEPSLKPRESPLASPNKVMLEQCSQPGPQQTLGSGQRRCTPSVREGKGLIATLSTQPLQRQAVHQQALDLRESKGVMPPGSPQQSILRQKSLHQAVQQQQVLDPRESKVVITAVRPQLSNSQLQSIQQPSAAVHEQALQQVFDGRESNKVVVTAGISQQQALKQQPALYQHTLPPQVLDIRESKGMRTVGSPKQQVLHQQTIQRQALCRQVLDARDIKSVVPQQQQQAPQSQVQKLAEQDDQQQHQHVFNPRESKGSLGSGAPQHQALKHQIAHPEFLYQQSLQQSVLQQHALPQQVMDSRESKTFSGNSHLHASHQQSFQQQVMDAQEGKSGVNARAPQRQAIQRQILHQQLLDAKDVIRSHHPQQQISQRKTLHQQALRQLGSHHISIQTLQPPNALKGYKLSQCQRTEQYGSSDRLNNVNLREVYGTGQPKVEPVELERAALTDRSSADKDSRGEQPYTADSASPKYTVSVLESEEVLELGFKNIKAEESKPSLSLSSAAESKDSVRSGSHPEGESLHRPSPSSGRTSRENMFADLNAEPPASDGEDDFGLMRDGLQMMAQPESSRTTNEENKKRKKVKGCGALKEVDEAHNRKATKPAKPRAKSKGEVAVESGFDHDGDDHSNSIPRTKEDKIKSLKLGLINVARKLPKNAHAHFSLGLMHQRSGQSVKAAQSFRQAAEILKQSEEGTGQLRGRFLAVVQVHQAQCLLEGSLGQRFPKLGPVKELLKEELENIVHKLKEAILLEIGEASVWNTIGFLLLHSGRMQSAIYVLMSLLEIVPDHVDTLANLGVAYLHSGQFAHASRCFQRVLEKDRRHLGALINYAALLLHQHGSYFSCAGAGAGPGAYGTRLAAAWAAQQCLESALKEDPKAGHVWANLAAAYSTLGNIARASQCLEQAAKLEPARMSMLYAIAAHRIRDAERSEDANEQLGWAANEMASILRGDFMTVQPRLAWEGLAMVNRAQHETAAAFDGGGVDLKKVEERALHSLQQAIEEDPEDAVQWHQMGLHTLCTLQFGAAQNYFKTAIALRRSNPSAWSNLGIALQLSEDPSLAEGVYKQALHFAPEEQAHAILSNLGNLYRQQRKFSEAHEMYDRALGLCPDYAPACNNLGLLLVAEGRWDDAIAAFDRALHADPYLDAAKSNRMKAVALSQIQQGDVFDTSAKRLPLESVEVLADPNPVSLAVNDGTTTVSCVRASSPLCLHLMQSEPFPLPSVS